MRDLTKDLEICEGAASFGEWFIEQRKGWHKLPGKPYSDKDRQVYNNGRILIRDGYNDIVATLGKYAFAYKNAEFIVEAVTGWPEAIRRALKAEEELTNLRYHVEQLEEALNAREEVIWFAGEMEGMLRANDHKGGWYNCSLSWLVTKLTEEVGEVAKIITEYGSYGGAHKRGLIKEAADVANIAMMIANVARDALREKE